VTATVPLPDRVGVLQPFVEAGVFDAGEVQLCAAFARLVPEATDDVLLALAVAARGPRLGHTCLDLADVDRLVIDTGGDPVGPLPWPVLDRWERSITASPLVAPADGHLDGRLRPLVWDGRLYLHKLFHDEVTVAADLTTRAGTAGDPDTGGLEAVLNGLFGEDDPADPDRQRQAVRTALTQRVSVIAGGPGTGKTRTIARLLAAARQLAVLRGEPLDIALAAPTGKAAGQMTDALLRAVDQAEAEEVLAPGIADELRQQEAVTLHRLLEGVPGVGFRRDAKRPLPHHLVVVDETSMVSLPLMAHLLEAVRPDATLVLVGDPHQLASIEAGSVMSDVVGPGQVDAGDDARAPLAGRVTVLTRSHRFAEDSAIDALRTAVRNGDADGALEVLTSGRPDAAWVRDTDDRAVARLLDELAEAARQSIRAARAGDAETGLAAMTRVKVLAATRYQPFGLFDWTRRIESAVETSDPPVRTAQRWYLGRPVIVTANDQPNRLLNGDVGLVVRQGEGVAVAFPGAGGPRLVSPSQLDRTETWWAMTIHKSQGSEFPHAVVSLPGDTSPILTRELLYTAVTRARDRVTVLGSEAAIRGAIARPIARASGLRDRLWPGT
jgi:exodeoxyribonuclease V alpha subunit